MTWGTPLEHDLELRPHWGRDWNDGFTSIYKRRKTTYKNVLLDKV